ncbi:LacI family transcriptional regulator [Rhodovulum sulfidophilum]|uniref:LacI family DNA-binding transcriptional regulator n=1 Tax=Rhodovulum visakhapatnamense TaxID=364297 RepID=A0A4R8GAD9_9RHOB|nr:LacI family DNA-binding transcriptional regulator [Rhodovulum visakhapatnamense]MBL3569512.1 LacI family DNA-binding transcriptional regulator [Rhodovulum visakhapatnamense]MBL3577663.1 LacI family DNA-binding transcriptional regulator [Rhodovulum visakhapatnamense]OLS43336.1 LacI family transcriptional regulator [Rhodovulum sulfidophilum]TDX33386.1 LacI family transcriptional regulator [Rhodovulum visakhapatnamense]
MEPRFVTAADVARRAGVSRSAVSRAFTPGASVAPETRARVLEAAEALGYRVNRLARTLHRDRSDLVGIIGANLGNPYISAQFDALSAALQAEGLQTLLVNLRPDPRPGAEPPDLGRAVERLLEYRVRTVVLLSGAAPDELVRLCAANGVRMVLINRPAPAAGALADVIDSDAAGGGRLAARRLIAAGCRRLAVVLSESRTSAKLARADAFCAEAASGGLTVRRWTQGPNSYETGVAAARSLLEGGAARIDGIFGVTDEIALGAMNTARHELGLAVPHRLSVIGFDDAPISAWSSHRLTTVRQSLPALTGATLEAILCPADAAVSHRAVAVDLVERGSVAPARGSAPG